MNIKNPKQILRGPGGIKLELNADQIFPGDPGLGTPRLVTINGGRHTGTLDCALGECEVDDAPLSEAQWEWLDALSIQADEWLDWHWNRVSAQV